MSYWKEPPIQYKSLRLKQLRRALSVLLPTSHYHSNPLCICLEEKFLIAFFGHPKDRQPLVHLMNNCYFYTMQCVNIYSLIWSRHFELFEFSKLLQVATSPHFICLSTYAKNRFYVFLKKTIENFCMKIEEAQAALQVSHQWDSAGNLRLFWQTKFSSDSLADRGNSFSMSYCCPI